METLKIDKNQSLALFIQRVLVGFLLLFHGIANLTSGYAFIKSVFAGYSMPEFFAYGAFIGEIVAPLLIIAGYRTRLAALALVFNMLVATLLAHSGDIFALNQYGGWAIELQAFYLFGALAVFFSGAGVYAVSKNNSWD
ncbi:putative oxidoreductase [Reichenbachiella faecimaris]|uniref:Putative oxidoreductase n=1 Tax=Reichenbachiella faecimaris TaxID=692418 RepID=A0A1W2GDZ2_REIFA|nr:DoxX family protein [Reichenbachiella faecimaris]SMD34890.1 putative oxidoreductase [Reichenbachiella faecimaris]